MYLASHPLHAIILLIEMLVHSVGDHQSEASPGEAVVNSAVMDGAAALHQALAGETFMEKERRLSEMIRQLQMVREQLLSQQELQSKVGRDISVESIKKSFGGISGINRCSVRQRCTSEISVGW